MTRRDMAQQGPVGRARGLRGYSERGAGAKTPPRAAVAVRWAVPGVVSGGIGRGP
jgi:hypothetical protein